MARDIIITPKNQEPQIQFTGSGDVSSINLNVGSGISPVSGIREAGSGITTLSFEGTQGQLFSITDNLSSGTIFSVADITGLPLLEVDASGAVKIAEYGISTTVGQTTPKYNFDVAGTGGFESVVSDKFEIYASGDALSAGQEKLIIHDNNGTFEVRASGQGGGSINNFKLVSDKAAVSSTENYITIDGQKTGDNTICILRLNGGDRFKFYNEGFTPVVSSRSLGASSSSGRWKSIWGQYLDLNGFNSTTTTLAVGSSASQSANIAEFKASDDVVIAQIEPDGSIASSGDISSSGTITGDSYKIYNVGGDGDTVTEHLELVTEANNYKIQAGQTGGGTIRPIYLDGHSVRFNTSGNARMAVLSNGVYNYVDSVPNADGSVYSGQPNRRWAGVFSHYGEFSNTVSSSGVQASGLLLYNHVPTVTTNTLYNDGGTLMFNGSAVGGGGGSVTGTPSGVAFFGDDESLTDSSQMFYNSGTNVLTLKSDNPQIEFRGADDNLALKIGDSQSNTNEGAYIGFYWQGTNNSYFDTTSGKTRFRIANGDLWFRSNSNADIAKMEGGTTDPLWSLYPQGTAQVGQVVKGQAAHSANLSEWHASDDVAVAKVEPDGSIASSGTIKSSGNIICLDKIGINTDSPNDLLEIYNGSMRLRSNYSIKWQGDNNRIRGTSGGSGAGNVTVFAGGNCIGYFGGASAGGTGGLKIGGAAFSETDYKFEVMGSGAVHNLLASGDITVDGSVGIGMFTAGDKLTVGGTLSTKHTGYTTNALRVTHNSNDVYLSLYKRADQSTQAIKIGTAGDSYFNGGDVGIRTTSPDATLHAVAANATDIGIISQGASSQSANLQEWRASDDSILAKVASDGDISTSGDISAFKYRNDGTNNLILDSTANIYVAFGGTINYGFFNTAFQPQIDNGRQLGTSSKRWSQGHIVNLNSVHGDFTGNVDVDGTVTGGLFKLYGLGDSAATDSEFLQVAHVANTYYISTKKTGSATGRDLILQHDSQNALKLASAEITSYKSMIPSTDGTLNLGSSSYKWGTVTASKLDIETTGVDDAIALTSTDAGSSAAPVFTMMRDSASPADGDYLGQIKFKGRSDTGTERIYAKITGKVLDASNTLEDGLIEIAVRSDGSNEIVSRIRNDGIRILNDNNLIIEDNGSIGIRTTSPSYGLDVSATGIFRQSVIMPDHVPATTTNALYNDAGTLKFNGSAVGGGGGSSTLSGLSDTNVSSPANGHILIYDNGTSKWDNALMTSSGGTVSFTFGAGTINLEAGVGPSDERLKENVKSIEDSLDKILAMNPVEFEWREGYEDVHKNSGKDIGFIAQEIEKIQPELVGEHKDFKTLDYEKFAPLIVGAIQDLTKELREIKKHLNM